MNLSPNHHISNSNALLGMESSRKKSSLAQNVEIDPETDPTGYKLKAVRAVFTALRNGTITRLHCQCCGAYNTEAHHADYSLPLAVTWLCKKCHTQLHNEHRDMLRDMASAEITT